MVYTIYCYTNTFTGNQYIGQTSKSLKERAITNTGYGYICMKNFYREITVFGFQSFTATILCQTYSKVDANRYEHILIDILKPKLNNSLKGKKLPPRSETWCRNISNARKNKNVQEAR